MQRSDGYFLSGKSDYTHTEFILNNDNLYFVETATRPAGALVCKMYEVAYGFNIFNNNFYAFCELKLDPIKHQQYQFNWWINLLLPKSGTIKTIDLPEFRSNWINLLNEKRIGKSIDKSYSLLDSLGGMVFFTNNATDFIHDTELLKSKSLVIMV